MMGPKRILIIDDEESIRKVLKEFFEGEGFEVLEAGDGTTAMEAARKTSLDVVLTDLKMPGPDGLHVLNEIRQIHPNTAGLIITGYPSPETTIKALELGCDGYLTKPLNLEHLKSMVFQGLMQRNWERKHLA